MEAVAERDKTAPARGCHDIGRMACTVAGCHNRGHPGRHLVAVTDQLHIGVCIHRLDELGFAWNPERPLSTAEWLPFQRRQDIRGVWEGRFAATRGGLDEGPPRVITVQV